MSQEEELLASVAASLHEQDAYEDAVIRHATHQLAPTVTGVGLPPLHALAPSFNPRIPEHHNPSDLAHIYTLLSKTRRSIHVLEQQLLRPGGGDVSHRKTGSSSVTSSSSSSLSSALDRLFLKEQLLLSFLSQVAHVPLDDLPVRLPEERAREAKRSSRLQRQNRLQLVQAVTNKRSQWKPQHKNQAATDSPDQTTASSSAAAAAVSAPHIPYRRSMMKRKQDEMKKTSSGSSSKNNKHDHGEDDDDDDDDRTEETKERREQLKQLRLERKRRRLERQQVLREREIEDNDSDNDGEMELEFEDETKTAGPEGANQNEEEEKKDDNVERSPEMEGPPRQMEVEGKESIAQPSVGNTSSESTTAVSCPLCQQDITVNDPSEIDAVLSQHMDQCQRRGSRPSRRATRRSYNESNEVEASLKQPPPTVTTRSQAHKDTSLKPREKKKRKLVTVAAAADQEVPSLSKSIDDLHESDYEDRVDDWIENGLGRMKEMKERDEFDAAPGEEEYLGRLWVPAWVNDRLFGYQRVALQWMWGLHQQEAGGLIGDEMGLGKTVQVSAYLGVLTANRKLKAVLVIAPATMLQHWLTELSVWAPGLRRVVVHSSGEADGSSRSITPQLLRRLNEWLKNARSDRLYEAIDEEDRRTMPAHSFPGTGYVVVTTYENVRRNPELYIAHPWSYVVLDEAQKIRNPDADVTLVCKRLRTLHRIAMSGTPIQNDLRELWSIFDFVFPGRLGTLPTFEQEFSEPIRRGGYSNATPVQVQLAYRCSLMLKDLIDPYLLRRRKRDVKEVSRMPGKTEHVLFCRLSERQRNIYEAFLQSDEVNRVLRGTSQLFAAVTMLRKICNHPDLVCDPDKASYESFLQNSAAGQVKVTEDDISDFDDDSDVADDESMWERSGKLEVLSKILPLWHKQGHRVLIFCQWRKMLNIIQKFTMAQGWKFGRLDGNTNVAARQRLVDAFNTDESYFGMLCTTRTGGVGLNLTGANRIILYDPDWNPQTDAQARERAWRFGQQREVTVYRLITAGTIEEKIYQRQIFKTALSNRVLQDPRQRRLFSQRDLRDLFTLKADNGSFRTGGDGVTETVAATKGVGQVDSIEETGEDASADNEATLRSVMKSKGLAGIFDHNFIEQDPSRKSVTTREMEEQAKIVAREAAKALRMSIANQHHFEPTWTGSQETETSRFGSTRSRSIGAIGSGSKTSISESSGSLLASLRQTNTAAESGGTDAPVTDEAKQYAKLLGRIKEFVRRRQPTTDDLLKEFSDVPTSDVAIFRRLLKSVAAVESGRWCLTG